MDISHWTDVEANEWAKTDRMQRVKEVEATYVEAKVTKRGLFSKKEWQSASDNFTRLAMLDCNIRAVDAGSAVAEAIAQGRLHGQVVEEVTQRGGTDHILSLVEYQVFEALREAFTSHDWTGSGLDANDLTIRLAQCSELLEGFVYTYLNDPPPGKGGTVDDDFLPTFDAVKTKALDRAFTTPLNQQLRFD